MNAVALYLDARLLGRPRWVIGDPTETLMRVPAELQNCTAFLCTEDPVRMGGWHFGGTAFFVRIPFPDKGDDAGVTCLVTARHNIRKASERGRDLHVRINLSQGESKTIQLREQWFVPESEAIDVAIIIILLTNPTQPSWRRP